MSINKLYKRLIIISLLFSFMMINISYCGAVPDTLPNQQIIAWINNEATEEELRHFDNFLERIGEQNNPNLVLNQEVVPPQRFGWERLGIFIGASILGYLFIKHGMTAWDMLREFLGELVTNSLELLRQSVTRKATRMIEDPEYQNQILTYIRQRRP